MHENTNKQAHDLPGAILMKCIFGKFFTKRTNIQHFNYGVLVKFIYRIVVFLKSIKCLKE